MPTTRRSSKNTRTPPPEEPMPTIHVTFNVTDGPGPSNSPSLESEDEDNQQINAPKKIKFKFVDIYRNCDTLDDLILTLSHPKSTVKQKQFVTALKSLNNMIGLKKLKSQITHQLLMVIQSLNDTGTFYHTTISGAPGTGKTTLISILANIYSTLGLLSSNKIVKADRSTLIGEYLGHTAIKTKKVLKSATGGILLIDEVYSLGSDSKANSDSFSKECIDTINQYLSENVDSLICIVCGYKKDIQKCFLSHNEGLSRRFVWNFEIEPYTTSELVEIFLQQAVNNNWKIEPNKEDLVSFFASKEFDGNGGSTRSLLDRCKIAYSSRTFGKKVNTYLFKLISAEDIKKGIESVQDTKIKNKCESCSFKEQVKDQTKKCSYCVENPGVERMYI